MIATSNPIDVWNAQTLDREVASLLNQHSNLIFNYFKRDHEIFLSHDRSRAPRRSMIRPQNPHAATFSTLKEQVGEVMQSRRIRAWHYTRLTDIETEAMLRDGIHLSTPDSLRARLDALVALGELSKDTADQLYQKSPFHSDQRESRSGKFWMTSHPTAIENHGIQPLIAHWGGEVASMWTDEPTLLGTLTTIGRPRVVELAVPIAITEHAYSAGEAVIATFARTLGSIPSKHDFDLYTIAPMQCEAVMKIHTEGEEVYEDVGLRYPADFVDVSIGRWKELTGEDD